MGLTSPTWEGSLNRFKSQTDPGTSVQVDWFGWLPEAKLRVFRAYAEDFDAYYFMLSVTLDEAIGLRDSGSLIKSLQAVLLTPTLCGRLANRLGGMLNSLEKHVECCGLMPSVSPLNPINFQGRLGKQTARRSSLLCRVLLSQRSQFLTKTRTLREMIHNLHGDYCHAAEQLSSNGTTAESAHLWEAMDKNQFDLNTCLRESTVLLKSFLRVLPDEQLSQFLESVPFQLVSANA